ncbi:MAG TPA: aspartyl/asparaginyl beta-hydroxylase domain-containing protein [Candidatus Eisenbacteria bacterium]|nr:aspartyl/asparaginyl beta-hydroxylase domain-containing protein [Candidatus Eisenbacteria bacterium]
MTLESRLAILCFLVGSAAYVHFRGRARLPLRRQLTDHSTFAAPYNVLVYLFSAVPRRPRLDVADFPHLAPLREHWREIRDEALRLRDGAHIRAAEKRNDIAFNAFFQRGWKRFYVKWYDDVLPSARALCPRTVELVESIPEVNAALFAFLPAGGKLAPHRDPFAGSLRYHLGLVTPNSDACRIWIDGEPYSWRDGEDVVFDETFVHRALNATDQDRIILFCDVERPLRTPVARAANRFVARKILKVTAAQNVPTEKVGLVNRVSALIYWYRGFLRRAKKVNRTAYYAVEYAVLGALLYLIFFAVRAGR